MGAQQLLLAYGGTLIVAIWCKEGLIICADRLSYEVYYGNSEDTQKIYELTLSAAFAFTGRHELRKNDSSGLTLSFPRIVLDFNESHTFSSGDYFQRLMERIDQDTIEFYSNFGIPRLHKSLITLIFFSFDTTTGTIESNTIGIGTSDQRRLEFWQRSGVDDPLKSHIYMAEGNKWAHDKIKDLSDHRFDDARANPLIQRFIFDTPAIADVTFEEAENFGRQLITLCSELTQQYDPETTFPIGTLIDSAILSFKGEFQWRHRH